MAAEAQAKEDVKEAFTVTFNELPSPFPRTARQTGYQFSDLP